MYEKGMKKPKNKYTELSDITCSVNGCSTRIKEKLVYIKKSRPTLCYNHHKETKS